MKAFGIVGGVLSVLIGTVGGVAVWERVHDYFTGYIDPEAYVIALGAVIFCFFGSIAGSTLAWSRGSGSRIPFAYLLTGGVLGGLVVRDPISIERPSATSTEM